MVLGVLKIGIVGCGTISRVHLRALSSIRRCKVVSVCDINENRAKQLSSEYEIPSFYTKLSEMLQKEQLDIVHVLTSPQTHAPLALDVMRAGYHVLVEKPMCINVKEADEMISTARRKNVRLGVVHSFLFNPAVQKALAVVKGGEIGKLVGVDALVSLAPLLRVDDHPKWMYTLPGGLFGEILPHSLYLMLAFLKNVREVSSVFKPLEKPSRLVPFSDLKVLMNSENGIGTLHISTQIRSSYTVMVLTVTGTEKTLRIIIPTATIVKEGFGNDSGKLSRVMLNLGPAIGLLTNTASVSMRTLFGKLKPHMTYQILIHKFMESVTGASDLPVSAEEGKEVVRVTEMIWQDTLPHS